MITKQIKYYTNKICFQEIPDEISFTYFITNCPNMCPNCHSPHLREDIGTPVRESLIKDLHENSGKASCILFMGGDDPDHIDDLLEILCICKLAGFKTGLYSGYELSQSSQALIDQLDYIKVGPYIENFGPLNEPTTNQRLFKIENGKIKENITSRFWRRLDETKGK